MKLLLTSAGLTNNSISKALLGLLDKPAQESNLAFIPTAANVEEGDKSWLINDLVNIKKQDFTCVDIVDISALPETIWKPRLEAADILFFSGGDSFYLMHWLNKSGLTKLLPELLKTRVYVGISAGSMVTGPNLSLSQSKQLYGSTRGDSDSRDVEGLSFVDFLIRPHLNSPSFPKVRADFLGEIANKSPEKIYAIDDNTAIKVVDGEVEIISEGEWKEFN